MHGNRLLDDEAICNELADGLTGVGVGDLAGLIGIEPNLALSAAYDGGRQALLGGEVDPIERIEVSICSRVYDASCAVHKVGRESQKASNRDVVAGDGMPHKKRAICLGAISASWHSSSRDFRIIFSSSPNSCRFSGGSSRTVSPRHRSQCPQSLPKSSPK